MNDDDFERDMLIVTLMKAFKKKFPDASHTSVAELYKKLLVLTLEELRQLSDENRR